MTGSDAERPDGLAPYLLFNTHAVRELAAGVRWNRANDPALCHLADAIVALADLHDALETDVGLVSRIRAGEGPSTDNHRQRHAMTAECAAFGYAARYRQGVLQVVTEAIGNEPKPDAKAALHRLYERLVALPLREET